MGFIIGIPFIGIELIIGIPMLLVFVGIAFIMMKASYAAFGDAQVNGPAAGAFHLLVRRSVSPAGYAVRLDG
jgi:hypothetical protein